MSVWVEAVQTCQNDTRDEPNYTIKLGEVLRSPCNPGDRTIILNQDEIEKNGIIESIIIKNAQGSMDVKVIGINPGKQKVLTQSFPRHMSGPMDTFFIVTVEQGPEISACYPGTREYNFFRRVFTFLQRNDLLNRFDEAVEHAEREWRQRRPEIRRGMIDWSRVFGRPMGYISALRNVSRMLHRAHRNNLRTDEFIEQIREIVNHRQQDIERHLRDDGNPDRGHDGAANHWRAFLAALQIIVILGVSVAAIIATDGVATAAVTAILEAEGVTLADVLPFLK